MLLSVFNNSHGRSHYLVHNGDDTAPEHEPQPHPLSPDGPVYPQTKDMPGSKLIGTDKDHPVPQSMGGKETRPMPSASNQVDKAPKDKELKQRYEQLVQDLKTHGNMTTEEAEKAASAAMKDEIAAQANSAPAMNMDPAKMDELCPK